VTTPTDEQAARCAWVCYLSDVLDSGIDREELLRESAEAYQALTEEQQREHREWRARVHDALDITLNLFCPFVSNGPGPCCSPGIDGEQELGRLAALVLPEGRAAVINHEKGTITVHDRAMLSKKDGRR
jgi:hypothetical protein